MTTSVYNRIIPDLPRSAYDKAEGLNASSIVPGVKSMKHMRYSIQNPKDATPQMRWGNLVHSVLLEPERFERDCVVWDGAKRGNAWKEFLEETEEGKEIITAEESEILQSTIEAFTANKAAVDLFRDCSKECSFFWETPQYGKAKSRLDGYSPNLIAELKTTNDISPTGFQRIAAKLLYHVRAGWYQVGVRELIGRLLPVYVACIEADPPHDIVVYEYSEEALAVGRDVSQAVAKKYRECEANGVYPGVCEDVRTLKLPDWMMKGDNPLALVVNGTSIEDLQEIQPKEL